MQFSSQRVRNTQNKLQYSFLSTMQVVWTQCYKVHNGESIINLFDSPFCACYVPAILLGPEDINPLSPEVFKSMGKINMKANNCSAV